MQYPSHAGGGMDFGADGYLYVTGGRRRGLALQRLRAGRQPGEPVRRPAGRAGTALTPPTAEGGRLRAQDMRTTSRPGRAERLADPHRPEHRAWASSGNPFFSSSDLKARRIIAYGFRNPFRLTIRPGTSEAWVGDVGNARWEEIDRHTNPNGPAGNYGWPCYEGAEQVRQLRLAEPEHLREPLRAERRGHGSVLGLRPQHRDRERGELPQLGQRARRPGVLSDERRLVPGRLRRRAVLRRQLAQLHLGAAGRDERPARPEPARDLRRRTRAIPST